MPPARRGKVSTDIRGTLLSSAPAQAARCAAWSSAYRMSSAIFCHATCRSRWATARSWSWSAAGQARTAWAVCRDRRSSGNGSMCERSRVLAMQRSGMAGLELTL